MCFLRGVQFSVLPGAAAVKAKKKSNPAPAGAGLAMMSLMILGHADVTEAEQAGTKSKATGNRVMFDMLA